MLVFVVVWFKQLQVDSGGGECKERQGLQCVNFFCVEVGSELRTESVLREDRVSSVFFVFVSVFLWDVGAARSCVPLFERG